MTSEAAQLLERVGPAWRRRDVAALLALLEQQWPSERLARLLRCDDAAVVCLAAGCLGMVGSLRDEAALAELLHCKDADTRDAAEDALWRLWMQAGSSCGNAMLAEALKHVERDEFDAALALLDHLTIDEPTFAEAHHQRGIVLHLLDRLEPAAEAYKIAIDLNPHHFRAMASLGHVFAQRGKLAGALRAYRAALRVHPGLSELREVVPQLAAAIDRRSVA